jgi:hypothetical protein
VKNGKEKNIRQKKNMIKDKDKRKIRKTRKKER